MFERGESVDVIVIGAGPAGLAAAHTLTRMGRRVLVLEQSTAVGSSWRSHRAGQRLHTVRRLSALPGMPIPRQYGRYVASSDFVRYLEQYADGIDVRFETMVTDVQRLGNSPDRTRWVVTTAVGTVYLVAAVVMATGYNRLPHIPDLPGLEGFTGSTLHVSDFAGAGQFAGRDVLVLGSGHAAAEAATELVATGAGRVSMAVCTTPHLSRQRVEAVSVQSIAFAMDLLPGRLVSALVHLTVPDLSSRSLKRPLPYLYTRVRRCRSVPIDDPGIVRLLGEGTVTAVAAVVGFDADVVLLADEGQVQPDVVMFATGYRRGLEGLLDGLGVLDEHGDPRVASGRQAAPGFSFVGFTVSATGALRQMTRDARRVANGERVRADGGARSLSGDELGPARRAGLAQNR
jgi:putative flavoprotein involved in K+ transport